MLAMMLPLNVTCKAVYVTIFDTICILIKCLICSAFLYEDWNVLLSSRILINQCFYGQSSSGGFAGSPVFIPLRIEYVRFLIKVAQTAQLSEAIHEAASVSHIDPR